MKLPQSRSLTFGGVDHDPASGTITELDVYVVERIMVLFTSIRRSCTCCDRERGSISVLFGVVTIGALAAVAMVVAGGNRLMALTEANDIADNAARAGAQAFDQDEWRATGNVELDMGRAIALANAYLDRPEVSSRISGRNIIPGPAANEITVEVTVTPDPFVFSLSDATVAQTARAGAGIVDEIGP